MHDSGSNKQNGIDPDFQMGEMILRETPKAGKKPEVQRYETVMWGGKIPVYKCLICKFQTEDKDRMILHAIGHVPEREQEEVFDELVEEGQDGE